MPLSTQIVRNGKILKVRWGQFHVAAMAIASIMETDAENWQGLRDEINERIPKGDPIPLTPSDVFTLVSYPVLGSTPLNNGEYVLTQDWQFVDTSDGEVFVLESGDILKAWR